MSETDELIDRIRHEVAKQHDVLLGRNDPILAMVTVNKVILAEYCDQVMKRVDASNEKAITAASAAVEASKAAGSALITESAAFIRKQVDEAIANAQRQSSQVASRQVEEAREFKSDALQARRAAYLAAIVAGFAAATSIGVAIGMLVAT